MAEETGETPQPIQAESIGKVESDPANPEIKVGSARFKFFIATDGQIFADRNALLQHEEVLREARTKV